MPNILPLEMRVRIVGALNEGNSIRATCRMTGVSKGAVLDLALRVGEGCEHLHNARVRGLACYNIEGDETWSFISKKEARCDPSKDPLEWGDVYTFIAMDAGSKVVISFLAGKRDQESTDAFVKDLRARLTVVPRFTTDGWAPCISAVGESFGGSIDYGQVVKDYRTGGHKGPDHRYEPPRDPQLTRRHETLGRTPAEAAKLADHQWTMAELVTAALEAVPVDAPRPVPLALHPSKASGARELPGGRGWLRVVGASGSPSPGPAGAPPPASHAPVVAMPVEVATAAAADSSGQFDLFAWVRPPEKHRAPRKMVQLDLFRLEIDPWAKT